MHGSQSRTEAETAAFGYPARALVFKLRVRKSDLWLSATCAVVTASDGLALPSRGGDFRSRSIDDTEEIFWGTPEPPSPKRRSERLRAPPDSRTLSPFIFFHHTAILSIIRPFF